jgi:hypothetical protein
MSQTVSGRQALSQFQDRLKRAGEGTCRSPYIITTILFVPGVAEDLPVFSKEFPG